MPSTAAETQAPEITPVDDAIGRMERLYQAMTGREAPPADTIYAPIPVERNPGEYVDEQMSRLLERLGPASGFPATTAGTPVWAPSLSICESAAEIVVRADLPGVARELLRVTMNGNVLTLSGSRAATPAGGETIRLSEAPAGAFRRVLVLAGADRDAEPVARMRDGVLEVRVAREAPRSPSERAIPIQ